jgi:pyruvate dehydrogenase E1 component alpha subunit
MNMHELTTERRIWMYRTMVKSRAVDDRLNSLYLDGKTPIFDFRAGILPGELHPSNGQEPCAVGVCAHLVPEDSITAGHRPHHVAIAKGVNLKGMVAEILGRATGLSGGRGGHMHIYDKAVSFGSSGIIAEGIGPAAGMAFAAKVRGTRSVAIAYIGEGAANAGAFHEVLNLAGIYKLPFILVVEDNGWAVSVPKSYSTAVPRNSDRAAGYGIPGEYVAGNDPDLIFAAAGRAVERARRGEGSTLLELQTTRLKGHFVPDALAYMPADERKAMVDMNPIYRDRLTSEGVLTNEEAQSLEAEALAEVEAAFEYAMNSRFPSPESAFDCVYA